MPNTAQTFATRLESFVDDVASLDVITFTGIITLTANHVAPAQGPVAGANGAAGTPSEPKKFNFDILFDQVVQQMVPNPQNELKLVAYTRAQWDMDSVNFVTKEPGVAEQKLIDAHQNAVEAAQKSRFEAVKLVAELIGAVAKIK
jgi:hypothetical protein